MSDSTNPEKMTRRRFLQVAGGTTFLALVPLARGGFQLPAHSADAKSADAQNGSTDNCATNNGKIAPHFSALPYLQPGSASRLIEGEESVIVAWQTEAKTADFRVEFGADENYGHAAKIARAPRTTGDNGEMRFDYSAKIGALNLNRRYFYRVRCNGQTVLKGFFTTRKPRGSSTRFVAFGDNACGAPSDHRIAYQAYRARPDFVMNTGDNVYDAGRNRDYSSNFFPVLNSGKIGPTLGAPLLRSVPFYTVLGNHDIPHRDAQLHPLVDFDKDADSLAYFTSLHLPLNGPVAPPHAPPTRGKTPYRDEFFRAAAARFPRMANYSFDYGDAHFLCLDANWYVDPTNAELQRWIEHDLKSSDALWKFAVWHHPAFTIGGAHYAEQHMRVLSPLLERCGVDVALHGHVHNYQRTKPLRFAPRDTSRAKNVGVGDRRVKGDFKVDNKFDGKKNTRANGVIYIITGAGGQDLYDAEINDNPRNWQHADDDNVRYVAHATSNRHSLSIFEIRGKKLTMKQIDEHGQLIDGIMVTKA